MRSTRLSCAFSTSYYVSLLYVLAKNIPGRVLIRVRKKKENEGVRFLNSASPGRWWLNASEVPRRALRWPPNFSWGLALR